MRSSSLGGSKDYQYSYGEGVEQASKAENKEQAARKHGEHISSRFY